MRRERERDGARARAVVRNRAVAGDARYAADRPEQITGLVIILYRLAHGDTMLTDTVVCSALPVPANP